MEWCKLRLLLTVLDPFIKLESNKVTGSLVVSLIWGLRTSMTDALDVLWEPTPDEDEADVSQT